MHRDELEIPVRIAQQETLDRIRADFDRLPEEYDALYGYLEENLFRKRFNLEKARRESGVRRTKWSLGKSLSDYVIRHRLATVDRIRELTTGRVATGRVVAAVGMRSPGTYRKAVRRCDGSYPASIQVPERLRPGFDPATWYLLSMGRLGADEVRALVRVLRRRCPAIFAGGLPPARLLSRRVVSAVDPAAAKGPLSAEEIRKAVEEAAAPQRRRMLRDAAALPRPLDAILRYAAEHLTSDELTPGSAREACGAGASALNELLFYLGDSLSNYVQKRRVEAALGLIGHLRLALSDVALEVGLSTSHFAEIFKNRTGALPNQIRANLRKTWCQEACVLWRLAGSGEISDAQARDLAGHLRALFPEAFADLDADLTDGTEVSILAVRRDVDPRRVDRLLSYLPQVAGEGRIHLVDDVRSHPQTSGPFWYVGWIGRRLGLPEAEAWRLWQMANRRLRRLLSAPADRRLRRIRDDPGFQTAVFVWLLVDAVETVRRDDPDQSAHFVDLARAAAEGLYEREPSPQSRGLVLLTTALHGNVHRMRNELPVAGPILEGIDADEIEDDWMRGRTLRAQGLYRERIGQPKAALALLFAASFAFKKAGDELEHLHSTIERGTAWLALRVSPVKLLSGCLKHLDRFHFDAHWRETAQLNRLLAAIYLDDRLTGNLQERLRTWRSELPPTVSSEAMSAHLSQVDGLLAHFQGQVELAVTLLTEAAEWFEKKNLLADAAVAYLKQALSCLETAPGTASELARRACDYLKKSGFRSHGLHLAADVWEKPTHQKLRELILIVVGAARPAPRRPC